MKNMFTCMLAFACVLFSSQSFSQTYKQGIGGSYNLLISSDLVAGLPGVTYKGSLLFTDSQSINFGVSFYPTIGGYYMGGQGSFGAFLPLVGEMYLGDVDDVNFNIGAGWNFGAMIADGDLATINGPQIGIGGQFPIKGNLYDLRLSYTKNLTERSKGHVIGFSFCYTLD